MRAITISLLFACLFPSFAWAQDATTSSIPHPQDAILPVMSSGPFGLVLGDMIPNDLSLGRFYILTECLNPGNAPCRISTYIRTSQGDKVADLSPVTSGQASFPLSYMGYARYEITPEVAAKLTVGQSYDVCLYDDSLSAAQARLQCRHTKFAGTEDKTPRVFSISKTAGTSAPAIAKIRYGLLFTGQWLDEKGVLDITDAHGNLVATTPWTVAGHGGPGGDQFFNQDGHQFGVVSVLLGGLLSPGTYHAKFEGVVDQPADLSFTVPEPKYHITSGPITFAATPYPQRSAPITVTIEGYDFNTCSKRTAENKVYGDGSDCLAPSIVNESGAPIADTPPNAIILTDSGLGAPQPTGRPNKYTFTLSNGSWMSPGKKYALMFGNYAEESNLVPLNILSIGSRVPVANPVSKASSLTASGTPASTPRAQAATTVLPASSPSNATVATTTQDIIRGILARIASLKSKALAQQQSVQTLATNTPGALKSTPTAVIPSQHAAAPLASNFKPSPCKSFSVTLRRGSSDKKTGGAVSRLQNFLVSNGYATAVTGVFGTATLAAVKKFQKNQGISQTGILGTVTRAQMNKVACAGVLPG